MSKEKDETEIQVNFDGFLKMGYAIIDVRFREYEISPNENLKFIIAKVEGDRDEFYSSMLKYYIGDVKERNVYDLWIKILRHKMKMSGSLNRDVSIKVAAIDFVENHLL